MDYKEFINKNINVYVSSRSNLTFKYHGTLESVGANNIILANASMGILMPSGFGSLEQKVDSNIEKIAINRDFIVSCSA